MKMQRITTQAVALHPSNHSTVASDAMQALVRNNPTAGMQVLWGLWVADKPLAMQWEQMNDAERLWWSMEVHSADFAVGRADQRLMAEHGE